MGGNLSRGSITIFLISVNYHIGSVKLLAFHNQLTFIVRRDVSIVLIPQKAFKEIRHNAFFQICIINSHEKYITVYICVFNALMGHRANMPFKYFATGYLYARTFEPIHVESLCHNICRDMAL